MCVCVSGFVCESECVSVCVWVGGYLTDIPLEPLLGRFNLTDVMDDDTEASMRTLTHTRTHTHTCTLVVRGLHCQFTP